MRTMNRKAVFMVVCVFAVSLSLVMPALAQEKKKPDKVWGTVVSGKADPSGKVSPVALETQKKEIVPLVNNGVAKKLEKIAGKKVEVEGKFKDVGGKKILEPWIFVQKESPDAPTKKPKADAG